MEGSHYDRMQQSLLEIDLDVKKAEAALSELRARLAVSATVSPEVGGQNELDEVVSRLKSLSVSFDEAEEMLKEQVS